MLKISLIRNNKKIKKLLKELCRTYSIAAEPAELVKPPEYPPIVEVSERARRERKFEEWRKQVQDINTIEEKLMKINMPKYYGWESVILDDRKIPFNALSFVQHCTRTHLIQQDELPEFYKSLNTEQLAKDIKAQIEFILQLEYSHVRRKPVDKELTPGEKEDLVTDVFSQQINRTILNNLSKKFEHLKKVQIDIDPRHEAFWFAGGFKPSEKLKKTRENDKFQKEFKDDPVDRPIQFLGSPTLTLRSEIPLLPIISLTEATNPALQVPFFDYHPKVIGYNNEFRHATNIPGFWPGDSSKFGILSYHKRGHILDRLKTYGEEDHLEALHAQAILSSFSWLHSQACYQGFSTYNDVTYPLVNQAVVTNGQYWSFYVYQLNTTLMHRKHIETNPRRNICWAIKPQKLYETLDSNFKLIGFNDKVLETILKFYINEPKAREDDSMTPYLGETEKVIADIAHDRRRIWLEQQFKHMMSNRPRHRLPYEIYDWERIYKIDHKTRQMEAKRRPFEMQTNRNPLAYRRYDEHHPRYVPKKLRVDGYKRKKDNRWEPTYYP